jgi:hypothetical protein
MTSHVQRLAIFAVLGAAASLPVFAQNIIFTPGNLVVSRSVYTNNKNTVTIGQTLPPNCIVSTGSCVTATNNGLYPMVWNNALTDGSFGITSKIFLDHITTTGTRISSQEIPSNPALFKNILVTSFSSKSELALNLSLDHKFITFMGYVSPVSVLDVSNSNTPGVVDPTNPVGTNVYRAVAQIDQFGFLQYTLTNAYSGNNGRAAILNSFAPAYYTAGNAGNGSNPQPDGVILGAGAQFMSPVTLLQPAQNPGTPTPVGSFNVTQLGDKADKIGKDTNFRGLTVFNNVLYYTKGSGGNGVNTVYFVDTTGTVCTNTSGIGLPAPGAALPTAPMVYNPANLQTMGVEPYNMCVLKGFPTALSSKTSFPFGIWFANATTLYVADEGDGTNTYANGMYTAAAASTTAGLQKWIFNSSAGQWQLAYTLQAGLNLGVPYTVPGYPTGNNAATGLPWAPGTDGLRNITGVVNGNGTATIYAITSTVSGNGDQGADPNMLVTITDNIAATTLPSAQAFSTIYSAGNLEVLRGVSFTPGTNGI